MKPWVYFCLPLETLKGTLSKLRDVLREQGFEIYTDEERGDFTFIEARDL
jgi:hypothetical protein